MTARRVLVLLLGGMLPLGADLAAAAATPSPAPSPRVRAAWPPDAARVEAAFVADINRLRAARDLPALRVRPELTRKARSWATTMAADRRIGHSRLSLGVTIRWQKLGENVGQGVSQPALHAALVSSGGHLRNLVDPVFRYVGVGVVITDGVIFVSEVFMQPPSRSYARAARRRPAPPTAPTAVQPVDMARPLPAPNRSPGLLFRPTL